MASRNSHPRRIQALVLCGILLVGGIAVVGGLVAVKRIHDRLLDRDTDPQQAVQKSQEVQFHLTEAIEEGFAYLVSGDEGEKLEFLQWAEGFPGEIAGLERLIVQTDSSAEQELTLLKRLVQEQEELVVSAKRLFVDYERTGGVDHADIEAYETTVDRTIESTRELNTLGLNKLETDRAETDRILDSAQGLVRTSALMAALSALIVVMLILYVLTRERAAREKAEEVVLDLYHHSPDMQISVDASNSRIVECNQTALDMLGYERHQFIGKPVLDVYDRDCLPEARRCLESFLETGSASADHLQLVTSSGERIDVSLRVSAVRDPQGRILRTRSVWRDIRTQVQTEQALESGEERYRNLVECAPVCIHEVDTDGKLMDMNAAGLEMIGQVDSAVIEGMPYLDFVQPHDRDRIAGLMKRALGGESVDFEFTSDSIPAREFQSCFVPVHDHLGTVVRLMGVTQDLTEHRMSERALRQKQKMEAIGRLAGGVAHDFNNLLTVVAGYCEELEDSLDKSSRETECVAQISLAADQAATLTRQLLAFSRNQERIPIVLELNEVIGQLKVMLERIVGENIALEVALGDDLGKIKADAGQIEQILVNLAANARDAMPTGGQLRIETRAVDDGSRVGLCVSDTGQGIDPEIQDRIFEPFYTTKETGSGSGLGLATVLGIVEQNEGTIRVSSEVDRGTRIAIEFPSVTKTRSSSTIDEVAVGAAPAMGAETILLVEDQEPVRILTAHGLRSRGYRVLEARDGVEALHIARDFHGTIDILVTDVVMPRMGGVELSETISEQMPDVKMVFVSGYKDVIDRQTMPEDAIFVAKPYLPSQLAQAIRTTLDDRNKIA